MVIKAFVDLFFMFIDMLIDILPNSNLDKVLYGLPDAGTFLNQVIGVSKMFVPWEDFIFMIGIVISLYSFKFMIQAFKLIK